MNIAVRQGKPVFDLFSDFKNGKEPFITSIATTYDCPAMCKHCSCEQQKKVSSLLTNDEMDRLIDDAVDLSSVIYFTGGEPLLRKDIFRFIERANSVQTILFTNGLYLNEKNCNKLAEAGLDAVMVSIISEDSKTHDSVYNIPGTHKKALLGLQNALNAGLLVAVATCISKDNISALEGILKLAYDKGVHEVNLREYVPHVNDDLSLLLDEDDWKEVERLELKYSKMPRPMAVTDQRPVECLGGGKNLISINPYGDVLYCDFNPLSFGNVKDKSLPDIIAKIKDDGFKGEHKCKMKCKEYREGRA
jgi:MoaA/NifB/PqqE/SkfB family radical SAM enzyme